MTILELFEGFDALVCRRVEQSCRVSLTVVDWEHLVYSKNAVEATSCQELAILSKLHHPDGLLADRDCVQVLEIVELTVRFLDRGGREASKRWQSTIDATPRRS